MTTEVLDTRALRDTLGGFVTGVTVVTTIDGDGNPRGFTANSFTSVSLDPPLILVCIGRGAGSFSVFQECTAFAVNILSEAQKDVSGLFASKVANRFDKVDWRSGKTSAPILEGSLGWLECEPEEKIESGDHLILIGRVVAFHSGGDHPLGFFRGRYVNFGLGQEALYGLEKHRLVLGCIVQQENCIMLCRSRPEGQWTVPTSTLGAANAPPKAALLSLFARLGAKVELSFLYSVFGRPEDEIECVIYRGSFESPWQDVTLDDLEARLFDPDQVPWPEIESQQVTDMLRRYFHERTTARFGIYVDSAKGGQLAALQGEPEPWSEATYDPNSTGKE